MAKPQEEGCEARRRWIAALAPASIVQSARSLPWDSILSFCRKALPAHIAVLILAVLALVEKTSDAIGKRSYLVLVYYHLFFFPTTPFAEHFENAVLNLASAAIGLAIAAGGIAGAISLDPPHSATPYASPASKAVGASVLIGLCLIGGFIESYSPRLKTAMRTMLFSITWALTGGASTIDSSIFTTQFYPAGVAAAASVVACALAWPQTAHSACTNFLVETLGVQRDVLIQSVADFYASDKATGQTRSASPALEQSRRTLVAKMSDLTKAYQSARIEVCIGRVSITAARPLLQFARKGKAWTSCGMGLGTHEGSEPPQFKFAMEESPRHDSDDSEDSPENFQVEVAEPALSPEKCHSETASHMFQDQIKTLLDEVSISISIIQACVHLTMSSNSFSHPRTDDIRWSILYTSPAGEAAKGDVVLLLLPPRIVLARRRQLDAAIASFRSVLSAALKRFTSAKELSAYNKNWEAKTRRSWNEETTAEDVFRFDMYDTSFLMITLLEMAKETAGALHTCQILLAKWHRHPRPRILWPAMTFSWWLRFKSKAVDDYDDVFEKDVAEQEGFEIELALREQRAHQHPTITRRMSARLSEWSSQAHFIAWRVNTSKFINAAKRSIHLRYSLKLAFGVAMLSLLAWLPGSRQWFVTERGVWLIVTYVWVLETSTGATFRIALYRAVGTISGALYAMAAWYICGRGVRPAIGLFIVLAELPASWFILCSNGADNIGVVFGLTQSIILLIPLKTTNTHTGSGPTVPVLGSERAYQILIGIGFAVIVNLVVWPLHARTFLVRSIAGLTRQLSTIYLSLARQMLNLESKLSPDSAAEFERLERKTQRDLTACTCYLDIMQSEVSLIPKPTETLRTFVDSLQRIRDLLVLLRRVRETAMSAIRAEACFNVLNLRTELVSSVLLSLWVVGESLLSKSKLPQFLPSCRGALEGLTDAMREQVQARHEKTHSRAPSLMTRNSNMWEPSDVTRASSLLALGHDTQHAHTSRPRRQHNDGSSGTNTPGRGHHEDQYGSSLRCFRGDVRNEKEAESAVLANHAEDYSFFFVLAEHALLSEMIFEIEKLLVLSKLLVGEQQFMELAYLPHAEAETPRTRQSRKRAVRRSQVDARLDTFSGDSTLHRGDAGLSANNSWMQGFGLTVPLPGHTNKPDEGATNSKGAAGLQEMFRPQPQQRTTEIREDEASRHSESHDVDLERDGALDTRDLSARLEREIQLGRVKSR